VDKKYTIKSLDPTSFWRLERHLSVFFPAPSIYGSDRYFHWKLSDNPIEGGLANIVENDSGDVASSATLTPKQVWLKQRLMPIAEIGDTYTGKQHLRKGLFLSLVERNWEASLASKYQFVYGTPNQNSLPGYTKKAQYEVVDQLSMESFFALCQVTPLLCRKMPASLALIIGAVSKILFRTWYRVLLSEKTAGEMEIQDKQFNFLPEGWDEFIVRCNAQHDFILDRSRLVTEWRYIRNPHQYHLVTLKESGNLQGFAIYLTKEEGGVKRINIVDLLVAQGSKPRCLALMNVIVDKAFELNAAQIQIWCATRSKLSAAIRRSGFLRKGKVNVIARCAVDVDIFSNLQRVHFSMGDTDNG